MGKGQVSNWRRVRALGLKGQREIAGIWNWKERLHWEEQWPLIKGYLRNSYTDSSFFSPSSPSRGPCWWNQSRSQSAGNPLMNFMQVSSQDREKDIKGGVWSGRKDRSYPTYLELKTASIFCKRAYLWLSLLKYCWPATLWRCLLNQFWSKTDFKEFAKKLLEVTSLQFLNLPKVK